MTDTYRKHYKRYDTGEPLRVKIISETNGQPVDLAGVNGTFHMYQVNDDGTLTELVNGPALLEDPATSGVVRYDWQTNDLDVIGLHLAEFNLVFPGPRVERYPRVGYIEVLVDLNLGT